MASSEKITGAMKMISSAKMHRAEGDLRRLLPFRQQIENIIGNLLSADAEFSSPLTEARDVASVAIVVLGSDDGLCGAYNMNIFKHLLRRINDVREKYGSEVEIILFPVGRKIRNAAEKLDMAGVKSVSLEGVDSKMEGEKVNKIHVVSSKFFP